MSGKGVNLYYLRFFEQKNETFLRDASHGNSLRGKGESNARGTVQ